MAQSSTELVPVSAVSAQLSTTARGMLQYVELKKHGTTILRAFIKHTLMLGQPITQIQQSIDELLTTFCGPIEGWKLPKDLILLILELSDIARIGVRSLRFTINNSPRSERIFMWNSKRWPRNVSRVAKLRKEKSESRLPGISML